MDTRCNRRAALRTTGAILAGAIAGCASSGDTDDDGETDQPSDGTTTPTTTPTSTTTPTRTPSPTQTATDGGETSIADFLADTSNYDGIEEATGRDEVQVEVGVEGNGAFFAFGPPAIRISQGATVTWTWTGQGGIHNVKALEGGDFESESLNEEGATFRQQFDQAGTVLYACIPHQGTGMKGAIVVD